MSTEEKKSKNKNPDVGGGTEDQDTVGHNVFATQDYFFQRNRDRQAEIERDIRERERAKEARESRQKNRR